MYIDPQMSWSTKRRYLYRSKTEKNEKLSCQFSSSGIFFSMLEKTKSLQVNSHFPKEFFVDYLFEGETDSVSVNSIEFVHCLSIYGRNKSINTKLTLIYTSSEKIIKLKLEEKEYEPPILFYRCSIVSECNLKSMVDADVDINYAEDFNDSKVVCELFLDSCSD